MASGKLFLADCGSLPFVFLFLQTMNFILKAIHHFAYEVMVPRLANNPTFQRFVVETNSTAKQAQEKLTQAASQQGFFLFSLAFCLSVCLFVLFVRLLNLLLFVCYVFVDFV